MLPLFRMEQPVFGCDPRLLWNYVRTFGYRRS